MCHVLSKICQNDQKHTLFSNFARFCTPKRCHAYIAWSWKTTLIMWIFFTGMISNFKYKCPPPMDPGIFKGECKHFLRRKSASPVYLLIYNIPRHARRTQYWSNHKLKDCLKKAAPFGPPHTVRHPVPCLCKKKGGGEMLGHPPPPGFFLSWMGGNLRKTSDWSQNCPLNAKLGNFLLF